MTVITMSTVGFGTIGELSENGMIFAIFLIIGSAGSFLYAISTITTFVVEGEIQNIFYQFRLNKKVAKLSDHIIICGLGRNGRESAFELMRQKKSFVVIEKSEEVIALFRQQHEGINVIQGDATQEEVLEIAGIEKAVGLISTLSTDAENVYITLTARTISPRIKIVARASHENTISKLKRAGANEVIIPNMIGGRKMANILTRPALMEFVEMVSGEESSHFHLQIINCSQHKKIIGKTIADLNVRSKTGATIIGIKSGKRHVELNPSAQKVLDDADKLFLIGDDKQMEHFKQLFLS